MSPSCPPRRLLLGACASLAPTLLALAAIRALPTGEPEQPATTRAHASPAASPERPALDAQLWGFVENHGQSPEQVLYEARFGALHLWCLEDGLALHLAPAEPGAPAAALFLDFEGPDPSGVWGEQAQEAPRRFFRGFGRDAILAQAFDRVRYEDAWPGVDLLLRQHEGQLEYDFELAPGASGSSIRIACRGAKALRELAAGALEIDTPAGALVQSVPAAWELDDSGERRELSARLARLDDASFGVELEGRDPRFSAVVDPVLEYATYVGGSGCDIAHDTAVDSFGDSVIVGVTQSPDFPTTPGAVDLSAVDDEVFVVKLSRTGDALLWSSYLGGSDDEVAYAVETALDGSAVYLTGTTSSADYPTTPGVVAPIKGQLSDVFVTAMAGDGASLLWSTFLGGFGDDTAYGLALHPDGSVAVGGQTQSPNFPVSPTAGDTSFDGASEGFVTLIEDNATSVPWSTFLGGVNADEVYALDIDIAKDVYVGGRTASADFPMPNGGFQTTKANGRDGFVAKLIQNASAMEYASFLGGDADDEVRGLRLGIGSSLFVVGKTESSDFPTTLGALNENDLPGDDGFVTRFAPQAAGLTYSTYFGGNGIDELNDIALDPAGTTYVVGTSNSTDYPVTPGAAQASLGGSHDAVFTVLQLDGITIEYSTYLGGAGDDAGLGTGHESFTGITCAVGVALAGLPTTSGAYEESFQGGSGDAFSICVKPEPCPTQAASVSLGTSCGGALLDINPPVQGTFLTFAVSNAPPLSPGVLFFSPPGGPPFQLEGQCDVFVDLATVTPFVNFVTDANGDWSLSIPQPNDPPRCAKQVIFQSLLIDLVGGPLTWGQVSNGRLLTIGS